MQNAQILAAYADHLWSKHVYHDGLGPVWDSSEAEAEYGYIASQWRRALRNQDLVTRAKTCVSSLRLVQFPRAHVLTEYEDYDAYGSACSRMDYDAARACELLHEPQV